MLDILRRNAAKYGQKAAVVCHDDSLTHAALLDAVLAEAQRLREEEQVQPGMLYQFRATQDIAYLVRFLALHVVGAICVPVDTPMELPAYCNPAISDMLFTTGSTSKPKGVLLSFDAVLADAENLIEAHRYSDRLTFIICGPIHHFGAWSKVMPTLVAGGTLLLLDGLKDVEALFVALGSSPCTATFLVPSAIRMLMQLSADRLASLAHNIDFIETGAAPIAACEMEQLRQLLPYTRLYNTYASTETGVVTTYPFHLPSAEPAGTQTILSDLCLEGCVGPAMRHTRLHLDADGRIVVSGRMIMSGYLGSPEADPTNEQQQTEVVTSDVGRLDNQGRLYIVGRVSDFINVGGLKVAPAEVEAVALQLPWVKECVCIAHPHPMMGQVPELLMVTDESQYDRKALIAHLRAHLEGFKLPLFYRQVTEIAKLFNGKIDRKHYALH